MVPAACLNFPYRLSIASDIDPKRIQVVVMTCLLNTWLRARPRAPSTRRFFHVDKEDGHRQARRRG
jgi:hypothetical protein